RHPLPAQRPREAHRPPEDRLPGAVRVQPARHRARGARRERRVPAAHRGRRLSARAGRAAPRPPARCARPRYERQRTDHEQKKERAPQRGDAMTALTETQLPALDEYPTRKDRAPALLYRTHPTVWGPVEDGPCTTEEIEAYAAAGYVRAGGLLTGDEIRGLAAELDRLRGDDGMLVDDRTAIAEGLDGAQVRSVYEVHRISDAFAELARDP